jgi:hypothetical protein
MQSMLDSVTQGNIVRDGLVQVIQGILEARRISHNASSLEAKYWFSIREPNGLPRTSQFNDNYSIHICK